jgi:orotate phosphoribosyltransferase
MSPTQQRSPRQLLAAQETANALLALNAVYVYEERPFIYTSGWASPVYVDCRKLMSDASRRSNLMDHAATLLREQLGDRIDCVAGAESAGIPFACWIAERLQLPMIYVRKKAMGWGVHAQIEGDLPPGARCLFLSCSITIFIRKAMLPMMSMGSISMHWPHGKMCFLSLKR